MIQKSLLISLLILSLAAVLTTVGAGIDTNLCLVRQALSGQPCLPTCNLQDDEIEQLNDLASKDLTGEQWCQQTDVDISGGSLTAVPDSIKKLGRLTSLDIVGHKITILNQNSLPTSLEYLNISYNNFKIINLASHPGLRFANFSNNHLTQQSVPVCLYWKTIHYFDYDNPAVPICLRHEPS